MKPIVYAIIFTVIAFFIALALSYILVTREKRKNEKRKLILSFGTTFMVGVSIYVCIWYKFFNHLTGN